MQISSDMHREEDGSYTHTITAEGPLGPVDTVMFRATEESITIMMLENGETLESTTTTWETLVREWYKSSQTTQTGGVQ